MKTIFKGNHDRDFAWQSNSFQRKILETASNDKRTKKEYLNAINFCLMFFYSYFVLSCQNVETKKTDLPDIVFLVILIGREHQIWGRFAGYTYHVFTC